MAWTCAGKPEEQRGWLGTVARELLLREVTVYAVEKDSVPIEMCAY